jgi:hypothetical protein
MTDLPEGITVLHGDSLDVLATLEDQSVDAVVTDPPYELGFMGRRWDSSGIAYRVDLWADVLRVLKPGGHLLAFGGTRTWHRLACAIEDAGFEIRDSIAWMYGSGFPKSLDVSKAIDKARDDRPDILRVTSEIARLRDLAGLTNRDLGDACGFATMAGHWTSTNSQPAVPRVEQWAVLRDMLNPDPWIDDEVWRLNGRKGTPGDAWQSRPVIGSDTKARSTSGKSALPTLTGSTVYETWDITAPATDAAREWSGWGTALKPAHEPIVVARKPLVGTVAANVLEHGTGALNIDACRIATTETLGRARAGWGNAAVGADNYGNFDSRGVTVEGGRWPANVILDPDQAAELDRQSGTLKPATSRTDTVSRGLFHGGNAGTVYADGGGGASRFFYVAKAPTKERPKVDGVAHPTVKPVTLMRYLVRLVTPPGGLVLDPFAGSGTTAEACHLEGFRCTLIERDPDYLKLIHARLANTSHQPPLL